MKILLVEDDADDAMLLKRVFRGEMFESFEVTVSETLAAALEMLAKEDMELVLLDLNLPDSAGLESLDEVRKIAPSIPIVILTGADLGQMGVDAIRRGAQDYLVKGQLDEGLLSRVLRYAVERKHAEQEREKLIEELQTALDSIKTLKGLIPVCAWCRKVRDDKGYWSGLEDYISAHSGAEISHGMCPQCEAKERSKYGIS